MGFFATFSIFSYWSTFIGGEVRQASTIRMANNMAIAGVVGILVVAVFAAIFFRTFGTQFMIAANGGGMPGEIPVSPTYFFLTSASVGSTLLAIVLFGCYVLYWPLICYVSFIQPTRMLFAYSFDGLLPRGITRLSDNGSPYVAVVIALAASTATLYWAVYQASNFFQVLVYATLIQLIAMGLVGLSAVVVPYTKPDLYRASATTRRIAGIPVITIAGAGAITTGVILWILYFTHPNEFGLADKTGLVYWLGGTILGAVVFYFGTRAVRESQGVKLDRVYAEIPPE
jgi:basic amino acid/polyamine antiporter, APA family